jgi:hypothetical protein
MVTIHVPKGKSYEKTKPKNRSNWDQFSTPKCYHGTQKELSKKTSQLKPFAIIEECCDFE